MRNRRAVPPLLGLTLCGLVLTLWACAPTITTSPTAQPLNGAAMEPPVALPPLTLTRSDGGTFTSASTDDRLSLFFFGYTHCADVCPLTLSELSSMRHTLGAQAATVDMYFVTLDPTRDTPERMSAYMANFPGVTGLFGSDTQLEIAQDTFHVQFVRRDLGDGDYMLDHTAALYLVNRASQVQLAYPYGTDPADIVGDLRRILT